MDRLAIALLVVGSLTLSTPWRWVFVVTLAAVAVIAARRAAPAAAVLATLGVVIVGAASRFTPSIWVAAAIAGLLWWRLPPLRTHLGPVRAGRVDRTAIVGAVVTVVVAAGALTIWAGSQRRLGPDVDESNLERLIGQVEHIPVWLFPLAAIAFALFNGAAEEFVYRGVVFYSLLPFGTVAAVVLQAAAFGAVHLNGFPAGWLGVAMATIYGLALGWLRVRTDGLLLPTAVHVAADLVIAVLVRFVM